VDFVKPIHYPEVSVMLMRKMTTYDVKKAVDEGKCVIVGFGSFEQHGPALPLDTDGFIAESIADAVAEETGQIAAPVMHIGYSTAWLKYPGTITFKSETYLHVILDVLDSLIETGFRKIVIINSHGTNPELIKSALRIIMDRFGSHERKVEFLLFAHATGSAKEAINRIRKSEKGGMWHAGELETALYMFLDPDHVKREEIGDPNLAGVDVMMEYPPYTYMSEWFDPKKYKGYFGDPSAATAENGKEFFNIIVKDISDTVRKFLNGEIKVRWESNSKEVYK
jgi:creatinine amidohydrolase